MAKKAANKMNVEVQKLNMKTMEIKIRNVGPLVVNSWSSKALREMLQKQMATKKSTKVKEPKDPKNEYLQSLYTYQDKGKTVYGFPATAFKKAMVRAVKLLKDTKQLDLDMIMAKQILFILPDGTEKREIEIPLDGGGSFRHCVETDLVRIDGVPEMKMDPVRLTGTTADLRFRGGFSTWKATLRIQYNADVLDPATVTNLVYRAGMTVGIGEGRPEKGDQGWGRFEIAA